MECEAVQEQLMPFALDELPSDRERELIWEHLQYCGECAEELEEIREMLGRLDDWQVEPPEPSMVEKTLLALEKEREVDQ